MRALETRSIATKLLKRCSNLSKNRYIIAYLSWYLYSMFHISDSLQLCLPELFSALFFVTSKCARNSFCVQEFLYIIVSLAQERVAKIDSTLAHDSEGQDIDEWLDSVIEQEPQGPSVVEQEDYGNLHIIM